MPLIWVSDAQRDRIAELAQRLRVAGEPAAFSDVIEGLLELDSAVG